MIVSRNWATHVMVVDTILRYSRQHRKLGAKFKYYLFEILFPDKVLMIAERRCPYCGRVFRNWADVKKHLLYGACSLLLKNDTAKVEELYNRLKPCFKKYRGLFSGIWLLEYCLSLS